VLTAEESLEQKSFADVVTSRWMVLRRRCQAAVHSRS